MIALPPELEAQLHKSKGALADIIMERYRQEHLCAAGKFPWTCSDRDANPFHKLSVLLEEVGEVACALNDGEPVENLKAELTQVAAVCVAWVEALE